ncbi:hypothetical protein FKM82_000139 [Ascaphus truei]
MKGNADCLRVMLTHGVDVSVQDLSGHSALHLAVKSSHMECAKRLLQSKCPAELTDIAGKTSMHYAAANDCLPIVQLLCEHKCPLNVKDLDGNTALLISVLHGHTEVCKYLVDHRADMNIKDQNGRTALMLACESGNFAMGEILVRKGADLKLTDALGHDALHYSRQSANSQILNLLLSKMSQEPGIKTPTKPIQHDQVTKLSSERSGTPKKRKAPPPPISPLQLSDLSSPLSSTSTPLSAKGQVFFPEQDSKDENTSCPRDYKDRRSDSTGTDSLLDISSEAEPQDTVLLLQAKIACLTSLNKELQDKLQEKINNGAEIDISCDSYHSTQTELNMSIAKAQDGKSPTVNSDNSDVSFESQPEIASSEYKVRHLEKTIEDMQIKLDQSEAERKELDAQIQSMSSGFHQPISEENLEDASESGLRIQRTGNENEDDKQSKHNLHTMIKVDQDEPEDFEGNSKWSQERSLTPEEIEAIKRDHEGIRAESERKDKELKDLQYQINVMTQSMVNMVSMERQEEMETSYCTMIEKINQEKAQLSDKYEEGLQEIKSLQKELQSQKASESSHEDGQLKETMTKTIGELSNKVIELSLLYNEAQAALEGTREAPQDVYRDFIHKDEHVKIVQEVKECKEEVEHDLDNLKFQHARTLEEVCQLKQQLESEKVNSPVVLQHLQVITALKNTIDDMELERNELRDQLAAHESQVKSLQEHLLEEKSIVQETMVTRESFEELQASLEEEINMLSSELRDLMKEKEKLSMDNVQVKKELMQLKGEKNAVQTQLKSKEQGINELRLKFDQAQEDLNEMKRFSENTSKLEEKDKKINELSKEVSKLKEALNSLSQLSFSTSTHKRQSQQLEALQQQVKQLQNQLVETKKQHQEIVSVYRMHLLYAVQGQMDEDVQKVLKQILTMCKSQSQKI